MLMFSLLVALLLLGGAQTVETTAGGAEEDISPRPPFRTQFQGQILEKDSRAPVAGADIVIKELNLEARSDTQGRFSWRNISLADFTEAVTVTVTAIGYGNWTIQNLVLVSNDTLILTPELGDEKKTILLPPAEANLSSPLDSTWMDLAAIPPMKARGLTLPETIRVRVTDSWECNPEAPYTVETVNFHEYVKHVLPNEWYYFWPEESLRAGAVAVKMYAWYWIELGGKWPDADVFGNTCDQWYRPEIERESTNRAINDTWNWILTKDGNFFETRHKNTRNCEPPFCMSQTNSVRLAMEGFTWDEILFHFYGGSRLAPYQLGPADFSLAFTGQGSGVHDRILIPVGNGDNSSPAVDVGAEDFTIEWWMKASLGKNNAPDLDCGATENWVYGNVLLDRDRPGAEGRKFGFSLLGGRPAFGVSGGEGTDPFSLTVCSSTPVDDGNWHHIAIQRSVADGEIWLYVDGRLEASGTGPTGDISYPDDAWPGFEHDHILVLGASRMDFDPQNYASFHGWLDEIRFSNILRYGSEAALPNETFVPDAFTVGLYHLENGYGNTIHDSSGYGNHGIRSSGGGGTGPTWLASDLFVAYEQSIYLPVLMRGDE